MARKFLVFAQGPPSQRAVHMLEYTVQFRFVKETIIVDPSSKYCTFRTLALLYHYAILKGHFVDIRLIKCPIVKYYCPILAGVRNVQSM